MAMLGAITKGEGINRKRCPVCGELEASMVCVSTVETKKIKKMKLP